MVNSLTSLASLGLLTRMRLWDVFLHVRGFLCHPNAWIRQGELHQHSWLTYTTYTR